VRKAHNSRATAARALGKWLSTGEFSDRLIPDGVDSRAFVVETVYGAIRWKRFLDRVVAGHTGSPPPAPLVPYLHIGLYQLLMMDDVPAHAAVNETVEAAKLSLGVRLAGLANAILRRAAKDRSAIMESRAGMPLDVRESHPPLLVERWVGRFGPVNAERLCRHNNRRPAVTLCPNPLRTSTTDYLAALNAAGIAAEPHQWAPDRCVSIPHGHRIEALPGYDKGLFSVQDPSTLAAVDLLDPKPGEAVLDACAAPGGKTAAIAGRMGASGRIVAADVSQLRLVRLRENLSRLGLDAVVVCRCNATRPDELSVLCRDGRFDRILVDAPCTNTGVLARRPDARWRFSMESLRECVAVQRNLLDALAGCLKPGGLLVYSTCSLETEEDSGIAGEWSLARRNMCFAGSVSLFPPDTGTDGAYAAAWRSIGD
jgi:16S rRNA (cytosine967-C5)-methyltransferase